MPSDHKIVGGEWANQEQYVWDCPPDCEPEEDCSHYTVVSVSRELSFTYDNGTEGVLVPFDLDDLCDDLEPCLS